MIDGSHVFAAGIFQPCLVPGRTYFIQLDGFGGEQGEGTLTLREEEGQLDCDTDGDGIPNFVDECIESDLSETVIIGDCDSGVVNHLLPSGCTISDLVGACLLDSTKNHGDFVSCIAFLTNLLKDQDIITGAEKSRIQRCAAQADIP